MKNTFCKNKLKQHAIKSCVKGDTDIDDDYVEDYLREIYCPDYRDFSMGDCCGANDIDFDVKGKNA